MRLIKKCCFVCFLISFAACGTSNISNEKGLEKYFKEQNVEGSFAIFNNGQGSFNIYNLSRFKDSAYLPASTFKIVNSLIGLQTGKITSEKMVIKWDGITRNIANWNMDLTMDSAFKYSAVPYYQEVAKRIGKETMQQWLDSLGYGSKMKIQKIDSFWLDNSMKVTADEQLGLVKKLYFNQLPFSKNTLQVVKNVMVQENNSNYILAYKTGWGYKENGNSIGWVIGWVEENKHPHFFVLNIEGKHDIDMISIRKAILNSCLNELGYLKGKK